MTDQISDPFGVPGDMIDAWTAPEPDQEDDSIAPGHAHYTVRLPEGANLEEAADALRVIPGVAVAAPVHNHDGSDPAVEVFTSIPHLFEEHASETVLEAFGIHRGPDTGSAHA